MQGYVTFAPSIPLASGVTLCLSVPPNRKAVMHMAAQPHPAGVGSAQPPVQPLVDPRGRPSARRQAGPGGKSALLPILLGVVAVLAVAFVATLAVLMSGNATRPGGQASPAAATTSTTSSSPAPGEASAQAVPGATTSAPADTVTPSTAAPAGPGPSAPSGPSATGTATSATTDATNAAAAPTVLAAPAGESVAGDVVGIGGSRVTVCMNGNGYLIGHVGTGDTASCALAEGAFAELIHADSTADPDAYHTGLHSGAAGEAGAISVTMPDGGGRVELTCTGSKRDAPESVISCTTADGAAVYMW